MPIQSCITFNLDFQFENTNEQFSDGVEVKYSEIRGRYAVATRNIPTGECLAVERALFSNTLPRNSLKNCYLCHKDTICPTPCDECSGIVFCSLECKLEGQKRYSLVSNTSHGFFPESCVQLHFCMVITI